MGSGHRVEVGGGFRAGPFASSDLADGPQGEHAKGTEAAGGTEGANLRTPTAMHGHLPHETRRVFEGRQLNAWSAFRPDDAAQVKAEIISCFS